MNLKTISFIFICVSLLTSCATRQSTKDRTATKTSSPANSRFTDDLPKLLETDAASVMIRAFTYQTASKLCARVGGFVAIETENASIEWRSRNDDFIKSSAQAINEIGNQLIPSGGEQEKQAYLQMIMKESSKVANQRITSQFSGANLNNDIIPPESVCSGLTKLLRDSENDYRNSPALTRALVVYMQRKSKS
jgi:hypothetical protein